MIKPPASTHVRSLRTVLAVLALFAMLAGSAACSSSSDTKVGTSADSTVANTPAATTDSDADNSDADKSESDSDSPGSTTQRPDGFPDIPLPEYTSFDVQQDGNENGGIWSVDFDVVGAKDNSDAELIDAYAKQLTDGGYEVTESEHATNGRNVAGNGIKFSYIVGAGEFLIQILGS